MWSRIILGEPVVSHLVKKFPHSLRQSFITISTGPTTFPHMNSDNTLQSCFCKVHFVICSFIVGFFHVVLSIMFPYKNPVCISFFPSYVPCPSNPPDFIMVITFGGEYESHMKDRTFKKYVILLVDIELLYFSLFPVMSILEISALQLGVCALKWYMFC